MRLLFSSLALCLLLVACSSSPQGQSQKLCYSADGDKAPPCVDKGDARLKGWLGSGTGVWCVSSIDDGPEFNPNPGRTATDPASPTCCYQVHAYSGNC
jgi:hypothetical protein